VRDFSLPLRRFASYLADDRGATAIEYCIIGGLISIVILAGAQIIGVNISGDFIALASGFH
jgi:pilus assembly protein Flp/PilA